MTYYTPFRTDRGWRFRCCMNAESEPFPTREECAKAAQSELARDTDAASRFGLRGDIYRAAFKAMEDEVAISTTSEISHAQPRACNGWNCLAARPDDEDAYGWQDGYCRECQAEIVKQEAADAQMRRDKEDA